MILKIPTELSEKEIKEFQRIYKEVVGEDISYDKAIEEGLSLIWFVAFVIDNSGEQI